MGQLTGTGRYLWGCFSCDWTHETETDEPIIHQCGSNKVTRLGDRIASGLEAIGITKEAWAEFTTGSPVPCGGCSKRQKWLNELDEKFGLGENVESLKSLLGWVK